jgi:hypothetical protein
MAVVPTHRISTFRQKNRTRAGERGANALPVDYVACSNEWIADKEAEKSAIETSRYRKVLRWTIVGAIAAIIAAVASVIPYFR